MKRRYGNLDSHSMIIEKEMVYKKIDIEGKEWYAYLHKIKKVSKEMTGIRPDGKEVCFLKDGFYWLILYPTSEKYAMTIAFTEKEEFVELYTDVIIDSGVSEENIAYVDDLFLDVVYTADKEIVLLDSAELEEAFNKKEITYKEYIHANNIANELIERYSNESYMDKYIKNICEIFNELRRYI